jgi:hypothetical protein
MDGDRCYGCNGKKNVAVKLTRKVLDEARVKVEAGELVRIREVGAARIAARKAVEAIEPAIEAAYAPIGAAHSAEYKAVFGSANWDNVNGCRIREFDETISRAQHMNNSLRRAFWDLKFELKYNKIEARLALQKAEEILKLLGILHAEWFSFRASNS